MSKINPNAKYVDTADLSLEQLKALPVNQNCKLIYRKNPIKEKGEFMYSIAFPVTEVFVPEFSITKTDYEFMLVANNIRKNEAVTKIPCHYRLCKGIRGSGFGKGTEEYWMIEAVVYMGHDDKLPGEAIIAHGFVKPKQMIHLSPELRAKFEDRDV